MPIVLRGHRFEGFTPEGERVVGWAHRIVAERDAPRADLARMRDGLAATLRIGAIPTAVPASPLLTEPFCARHPQARVRIEVSSSREIRRRLAEFDLDVGLTYLSSDSSSGLCGIKLYQERYLLLTPEDGPMAGRAEVDGSEAAELPQCALTRQMHNRRILDGIAAEVGAELRPSVDTDTVAALYAHLATRRWSSIIAHAWLHAFGVPPGMRAIPLTPRSREPAVGVVWPDRRPESIVVTALLEVIGDLDVAAALADPTRHGLVGCPPGLA